MTDKGDLLYGFDPVNPVDIIHAGRPGRYRCTLCQALCSFRCDKCGKSVCWEHASILEHPDWNGEKRCYCADCCNKFDGHDRREHGCRECGVRNTKACIECGRWVCTLHGNYKFDASVWLCDYCE